MKNITSRFQSIDNNETLTEHRLSTSYWWHCWSPIRFEFRLPKENHYYHCSRNLALSQLCVISHDYESDLVVVCSKTKIISVTRINSPTKIQYMRMYREQTSDNMNQLVNQYTYPSAVLQFLQLSTLSWLTATVEFVK